MQDQSATQFEVADPPTDGITNVVFNPEDSRYLLVSSWDTTVRLYDVEANKLQTEKKHVGSILDVCYGQSGNIAYHGGIEKQIRKLDLTTNEEQDIGKHDEPVRCLRWNSETNNLYTGSWDNTLRVWDDRSAEALQQTHQLPHKVFAMDLCNNKLVVGMANRQIYVYDIRNMNEPWQTRETSLRYMLRSVRCMPNGEGYACCSIEGRVSLEFFDMSPETQAKKYAFKSHRHTVNDTEVVYPVNALAFHPIYGTFASGGSDGVVSIWDGVNRKRIRQLPRYPDEIASLAFSTDGKKLAVASSYTFDEGERDHAPDAIFIKTVSESDCKPRTVANGS